MMRITKKQSGRQIGRADTLQTLISGKVIEKPDYTLDEKTLRGPQFGVPKIPTRETPPKEIPYENEATRRGHVPEVLHKAATPYIPPKTQEIPFPGRVKKKKKFEDMQKTMSKVKISLPLVYVIKTPLAYSKFFEELATNKKKYEMGERAVMPETTNSVLGM